MGTCLEWRKMNKNRIFLDNLLESGHVGGVLGGIFSEDGCYRNRL
jgi:hypothetical protein